MAQLLAMLDLHLRSSQPGSLAHGTTSVIVKNLTTAYRVKYQADGPQWGGDFGVHTAKRMWDEE